MSEEPKAKHTPGPWRINSDNDGDRWIEAGNHHPVCLCMAVKLCGGNREANARLIAAAPELLAALKAAIRIADEARNEWDAAPSGMKAGKLLIALSGNLPGYRQDIDDIHTALKLAGAP